MAKNYKMYLGGKWVDRKNKIKVINPYDNSTVGMVSAASPGDYTKAIDIAHKTFRVTRELPSYKREETCRRIAAGLEKNIEKLALTMSRELGKAYRDARGEVTRAIGVFKVAAEEAKRIGGEIVDLDWAPGAEERVGLVRRFPMGVIAGISPFNFPLNLVAHKVAPAIASGNTIVLKPASKTPILALMLAELIDKTDHPKGAVSILPGSSSDSSPLLHDERVKLITFTGSSEVGWWIKSHCGKKPVVLELGGNAGVAIADDADLDYATTRLLYGAFAVAGQSCISVQRIFVHQKVYDRFLAMFKRKVKKLKVGNPLERTTDVGTMVDEVSVQNTLAIIKDAVKGGARILVGGKARGILMEPTVLTDVKSSMDVCSKEAFAPLAVVSKYRNFKEVVDEINNSEYGLQAGVFTNRMKDVFYAFSNIECGGVVVNDVPTYRADHQPYGGTKNSGLGREGVRYSIEDMTEIKILSMNLKTTV
ncbi:MAG: aldehyde dehydrogenase family protein [Candidatus Zixiibacteriota bacterium]|nr:MAG: aldehyde dehydrogenase family protein [candidate division Zixibacteria bacterium]